MSGAKGFAAAKAIDHREALAFLHSSRRRHWHCCSAATRERVLTSAAHAIPFLWIFASKSFIIMLAPASRAELRYFTRGSKHSSGGSIQVREIYLRSDVPRGTAACYAPLEQQISEETKETTHNAWKPLPAAATAADDTAPRHRMLSATSRAYLIPDAIALIYVCQPCLLC